MPYSYNYISIAAYRLDRKIKYRYRPPSRVYSNFLIRAAIIYTSEHVRLLPSYRGIIKISTSIASSPISILISAVYLKGPTAYSYDL